jgi:hypothetical protein
VHPSPLVHVREQHVVPHIPGDLEESDHHFRIVLLEFPYRFSFDWTSENEHDDAVMISDREKGLILSYTLHWNEWASHTEMLPRIIHVTRHI